MDGSDARAGVLCLRRQLSRRCEVRSDCRCRGHARHSPSGGRRRQDNDRSDRAAVGIEAQRLAADSAYGSAPTLNWIVNEKKIAPHIPVIDKSVREDGIFNRDDFTFDKERNLYTCPAGKTLTTTGRLVNDGETLLYMASMRHCRSCSLKAHCCPKA